MRETDTHIYFFRNKDIYSNFYYSNIKISTITFCCSEQALMYFKARLFKDDEIAGNILQNNNPHEIKQLGRKVKNFDENIWLKERDTILFQILYQKFCKNPYLKKELLKTNDKILVEASPYDKIYGVGLSEDNDNILDDKNWKGENLLGNILMNVRDMLKIKDHELNYKLADNPYKLISLIK